MMQPALSREAIRSVIEGRGEAERIPLLTHMWVHSGAFGDQAPEVEKILQAYPDDIQRIGFGTPDYFHAPADAPSYRWVNYDEPKETAVSGLEQRVLIKDWNQLPGILEDFPDPHYHGLIPKDPPAPDGRYRMGNWWYCFFERHWSLRGMTNALTDYYTDPESVHKLYRKLTDFYLVMIERGKKELDLDGIFTSDNIGMQTGPFFSLAIFREFFKPYYKELIDKAHSLGMHFMLHTCGNIELYLPEFIEIGLDVIHPIQKYTMDEREIARKYGDKICILAGFDVQHTIPYGSPEDVRKEVRFMFDAYRRPEGRLMFTAGNGVTQDCPVKSLAALFEETNSYGINRTRMVG